MAPMEGLTDFTYRNAYEKTFGKGRITKYFTPFISPNKSENFLAREIRDEMTSNNLFSYSYPTMYNFMIITIELYIGELNRLKERI